eukprot:SAG22_NODE_1293_length_4847_cov_1.996841_3_plen_321_part_00
MDCVLPRVLDPSETANIQRCGQGTEAVKGAALNSSSWVSRRHESGAELRTVDGVLDGSGVPRIDLTRGVVVEASVVLRDLPAYGVAGLMINHACTAFTGGGTPPAGVPRHRRWSHDPTTAGASLGAQVDDPIHQRWCTPEAAGTATLVAVNSAGVVSFQTWGSAPPPVPGRFVVCSSCHPSPQMAGIYVYWLSNVTADQPKQVLHQIASCSMCGRNLCSFCTGNNCSKDHEISPVHPQARVPMGLEGRKKWTAPEFAHPLGSPFECCMLPGDPSAPCSQWKIVEVIDRQFPFWKEFAFPKTPLLQVFVRHTLLEVYLGDL